MVGAASATRTLVHSLFACSALATLSSRAIAAGQVDEARTAYDNGAAAYDAGDYARAAAQFARADELVPNERVLKIALDAALHTDDPVVAMTLAERAEQRRSSGEIDQIARAVRGRFAARAGKVSVLCRPGASCKAKLDAAPIEIAQPRWIVVGVHAVELDVDGSVEPHTVRVEPGKIVQVEPYPRGGAQPAPETGAREPPPTRPERANSGGLSPTWFWVGVGVTGALGGVTIWSGIDTANQHDAFVAKPSAEGSHTGVTAQTRTNVLVGVTAGSAVVTSLVGLLLVRWRGAEPSSRAVQISPRLSVSPDGASVVLGGAY